MEAKEITKLIEKYITEDKTKEAINCLADCQFENGNQEVILLKSRFNKAQKEVLIGVLSREEANRELAQINLAVLELTQYIICPEEEDVSNGNQQVSVDSDTVEPKILPGQLDKTLTKDTTVVGTSNFQLDETLDKKITSINTNGISVSAIELETTDRRVQNNEGVFRIETSVLIGRHPDCDIIILDKGISRQHARIFRQGDQLFISDENSTNGTFWNDHRINQIAVTEDGILRLDEVNFELRVIKR